MIVKLNQIQSVLSDKGSRYAVSGMPLTNKHEIQAALKQLQLNKKFSKATHHSWAVRLADGKEYKNDDGESGAGMVMLRILNQAQLQNHLVIVSRWYGGKKTGR